MKDILVVEDGAAERQRLFELFSGAGYSVVACDSVGEAEKALTENGFRLAILDIGLNDRSGSQLFHTIARVGRVQYTIIFTGNPSLHLKERFINEGAVDYIVKGSAQAQNVNFLDRVKELLGVSLGGGSEGIPLQIFMDSYIQESSRAMFLEPDGALPVCRRCKSSAFVVTFKHEAQVPPNVVGLVVCSNCGLPLDPEVA